MGGDVPSRRVKPPGRSLERRSNASPRGMAVPPEQSDGQNSAYRSGCHKILSRRFAPASVVSSLFLDPSIETQGRWLGRLLLRGVDHSALEIP